MINQIARAPELRLRLDELVVPPHFSKALVLAQFGQVTEVRCG